MCGNGIRRRHPALQQLRNITFHRSEDDSVIAYSKCDGDETVRIWIDEQNEAE